MTTSPRCRTSCFGTTVCSRAWTSSAIPDPAQATFRQAWDANRNILVLYAKGELPKNACYRARETNLYSPWPNTEDPAVSTTANAGYLQARKDGSGSQTVQPRKGEGVHTVVVDTEPQPETEAADHGSK